MTKANHSFFAAGVLVVQKATDVSGAIESYVGPMAAPSVGTTPFPVGEILGFRALRFPV